MLLLEVDRLRVAYGPLVAVRDVSVHVQEGELVALIGANGAGKSSTLRAISGLIPKQAGTVVFAGRDITSAPSHTIVQHGLAHVPEGRAVIAQMTVAENLEMGAYTRHDRAAVRAEIGALYERFPILGQRRHLAAAALSGGEQQMLVIGRGLLSRPRLLLLDEPSLGLAPQMVREVFAVIRGIQQQGTTVLLVEQNARKALALATHAVVLENGQVTLADTGAALAGNAAVARAYLGGHAG